MSTQLDGNQIATQARVPRLGFLGVGWIGRHRMEAVLEAGAGSAAVIADPSEERVAQAMLSAPGAVHAETLDELLDHDIDGVVIATPSALHAQQAVRAFERGVAVFSQKPLGRTAAETRSVIGAARAADRLLGIDLSYRHTAAMQAVRHVVRRGDVGTVYTVDLVFHNAYGPDMGWARDPSLAGGGCVIDLGVHLVDMALWTLDFPRVVSVSSQLFAGGERIIPSQQPVCEDYALATVELQTGTIVRIACSWECSTGRDAVIEARFTGSMGAVALHNVAGSFYDFTAELYRGTSLQTLTSGPDAWGGRALIEWTRRLARDNRFDPAVETAVDVAATLDGILGR